LKQKQEIELSKTLTLLRIYKVSWRTTKLKQHTFTAVNGNRNAIFILDIPSADMMPVIAEPFFQMVARVEFFRTMNLEELKKGLSAAIR
jgi:hypothetical protein